MFIKYNGGRFSYKSFYFLILVICFCFKSYDGYHKYLDKNIIKTEKIEKLVCSLFTAIFDRNFYIFSIILYIIEKKQNQSTKKEKKNFSFYNFNKIDYSYIKDYRFKLILIKSILLIFICFLISILLYTLKVNNKGFKLYFTSLSFAFITIFFFNFILFHKKIYKHHKIALYIIILFNIPIFIYYSTKTQIERELFNIAYFICYSIIFIIYQFIIEKYYMSVYFIFFIEGLMNFISTIIILIIIIKKEINFNFSYKDYIINNIFYFILQLFYLLNIYYFSPIKCLSAEIIARAIIILCFKIYVNKYDHFVEMLFDIFLNPLNLIMILIYDEIIILNFCGLDENIQENIIHRQKIDLGIIKEIKKENITIIDILNAIN